MKTSFLKQSAGALIAIALVVAGSVGAYAAVNWFNGSIKVTADSSIMHIDLTGCKGFQLGGVETSNTNLQDVQFKILGSKHITADELQRRLLTDCEAQSVLKFYNDNHALQQYGVMSASVIKAITLGSITLEISAQSTGQKIDKVFTIAKEATFYDKGQLIKESDLKVGDTVEFVVNFGGPVDETQDALLTTIKPVLSVFKTQYDLRYPTTGKAGYEGFYSDDGIMPLAMYNQINNKNKH